jgi:putative transposase
MWKEQTMPTKRNAKPTKTYCYRLGYRPQAGEWFAETQNLFNRVAAFYFDVIQSHPGVLELADKAALTTLEKLSHATKHNPDPVMPLSQIAANVPAMFRRAAIHAALGSARSFHSNLERWRKQKEKAQARGRRFHHHPPVPPREWNKSIVLYAGMWKDWKGSTIILKVWTGQSWAWVKFDVAGQPVPEGWEVKSPQVVRRGKRWCLHVPAVQSKFPFPSKVEKQLGNPTTRICAVDLNINDALAVCTIQRADGTVVATRFIRGGRELQGRRKRALGRVAVKRSQAGVIGEGETDNAKSFRYIRNLDDNAAHLVSRRIVDFASEYGAMVIVFEHLGSFRPEKGKYSKRGNEKRSYWLRGRIFRYAKYKAWACGIITCRVNPCDTSRLCAGCGQPVVRYSAGEAPIDYRPGAPLFLCANCGLRGNADRNASINIGHKLIHRTCSQKPSPKGEGVAHSYSIPVVRSGDLRAREQGKLINSASNVGAVAGARPSSSGSSDQVGTARGVPRPLRPQTSSGQAAITLSAAYAGAPKEAAPL